MEWQPLVLTILGASGAIPSAFMEAEMIDTRIRMNDQSPFPHLGLTVIRFLGATLIVLAVWNTQREFWTCALSMVLMMGTFAPVHRTLLNAVRIIKYRHRISLTHLGTSWYDTLATTLTAGKETLAFCLMCAIELLIAGVAFDHLNNP